MKKRPKFTPRLDAMEERVVLTTFLGMNIPPSLSSDFHWLGDHIKKDAVNVKNYVQTLNQNRPGQSIAAQWSRGSHATHPSNNGLFGIHWLKI